EPAKKDDAAKKEEAPKKDEVAKKDDAEKKDDAAKNNDVAKKEDESAKNAPAAAMDLDKIIAERKRIEQENQHKLDEYQTSIKKGQESVKDLNLRFGDWYFVVSDDVYRKIRLSRDKVVKAKEKPKADAAPGQGGLKGTAIPGLPPIPGTTK